MVHTIDVFTESPSQWIDITGRINAVVREQRISEGICHVFVPHTTAAITINENADPDVMVDLFRGLDDLVPRDAPHWRHGEGNAAAHIKASLLGASQAVIIRDGRLVLGAWQSLFLCEFDGPRRRNVWLRLG